jgi:hypothetical protein
VGVEAAVGLGGHGWLSSIRGNSFRQAPRWPRLHGIHNNRRCSVVRPVCTRQDAQCGQPERPLTTRSRLWFTWDVIAWARAASRAEGHRIENEGGRGRPGPQERILSFSGKCKP